MNPLDLPVTVKCQFCEKYFSNKSNCTRHITNVHKLNVNGDPIPDRPRERFICALCDKNFAAKQILEHHMNVVHLFHLKKHKCSSCKYETMHRSNLKRHILGTHKNGQDISEICRTQYFKCSKCPSKFKEERNLKYHQKKSHKLGVIIPTRRKCPVCPYISIQKTKFEIYNHFKNIHDIPIRRKSYEFDSGEEFDTWKIEMEKETNTYYVKKRSSGTFTYYQCHRCGYHRSKGHLKRRMKMSGSCKINGFCPANITMKVKNNKVLVSFIFTHIGHKNDLKYLRLTNEENKFKPPQRASWHQLEEDLEEEEILSQISQKSDKNIILEESKLNIMITSDTIIRHITTIEQATFVRNEFDRILTTLVAMNMSATSRSTLKRHTTRLSIMMSSTAKILAKQGCKMGMALCTKNACILQQSLLKSLNSRILCSNSLHTTSPSNGLMDFFDDKDNWGEETVKVGRSWKMEELRIKSNSDLHKLWYVLLKERNMLLSMEHECKEEVEIFPNPERIDKVNESMHNLEEVVIERNKAYHELETGETGLRPAKEVINQIGLPYFYRMTEHLVPKEINKKWKETHIFRDNYEETKIFHAFLEEERKRMARNNIKGQEAHVMGLLRRFPNVDIEAIKEKFPEVDVDKLRIKDDARSHSLP